MSAHSTYTRGRAITEELYHLAQLLIAAIIKKEIQQQCRQRFNHTCLTQRMPSHLLSPQNSSNRRSRSPVSRIASGVPALQARGEAWPLSNRIYRALSSPWQISRTFMTQQPLRQSPFFSKSRGSLEFITVLFRRSKSLRISFRSTIVRLSMVR